MLELELSEDLELSVLEELVVDSDELSLDVDEPDDLLLAFAPWSFL